ncbi:hypothetical protein [Paucilactobacillus vaccinostercus]|uniref:hypothetical protein n=1 Tax=Paucilactobacillus vaccinostercus TaxID=176291 RepID=UPI000ABC75ED|nr:hypothetical protein [Paucilactobacillus vaccinostercus]
MNGNHAWSTKLVLLLLLFLIFITLLLLLWLVAFHTMGFSMMGSHHLGASWLASHGCMH